MSLKMSNSTDGMNSSSSLNKLGLSYGIVISVGTMVVLTTILLVSYVCIRVRATISDDGEGERERGRGGHMGLDTDHMGLDLESPGGLDEATLDAYPKMMYSDKLPRSKSSHNNKDCCSICLTDYVDSDMLRLMPDCNHMFHMTCADEWLRRHPTCPMCRVVSPLPSATPTPLATPLSDFVPLARNDSLSRS